MTKYEKYIHQAELCEQAASRTSGRMHYIWIEHAAALRLKALKLTLKSALSEAR